MQEFCKKALELSLEVYGYRVWQAQAYTLIIFEESGSPDFFQRCCVITWVMSFSCRRASVAISLSSTPPKYQEDSAPKFKSEAENEINLKCIKERMVKNEDNN